ncbi:MAG: hypothetical protein Q4C67_11265 [Deinococcus sp.]|nr:hypothetical protein [Deinococcus sp.]
MTRYQRTNFDHLTPEQRQSEPSSAASLLWHLGSGLGQSCLKGSVFSREDLYQTAQAHNQHFGDPP